MEEIELNSRLKIEEFFESKRNYESKKNKMKRSRIKKPLKCILCQKKGGTNFHIQDKHYVIECDSFESNCKNNKTIIERIRKVLIHEYIQNFNKEIIHLEFERNEIEYKNKYFQEEIDENKLKSINDQINSKKQKLNVLYQYIEDKNIQKEQKISELLDEKQNDIDTLNTELGYFQPDYGKILEIQKQIKEKDENVFNLRYPYSMVMDPLIYTNKDAEFGDCETNNNYVLYLQEHCLEEMEELFDENL